MKNFKFGNEYIYIYLLRVLTLKNKDTMKGTLPIQLNYKVYNECIIPADIHAN